MLRSPEVTPVTAIGVVLFSFISSICRWQWFITMNFNLLLQLWSRGTTSIPKQYRVGRASFVQDELFIQLATLDQDDPYGRVWSSFLAPSVAPLSMGCPGKCMAFFERLPVNWCHVSWSHQWETMSIYLIKEHATCLLLICCVVSGVRVQCL